MIMLLWWLLFCGPVEAADPPPGGYYTTRYDHIEVDNILNQKRLVHYYSACLLDKGPCTPQGLEFKRILPEAIKTNCLRCTEKQRVVTMRSIRRLKKQYPDVWAQLAVNWDPTGEYVQKLEESYNKLYPPRSPPIENVLFGDRFGSVGGGDSQTSSVELITTTPPPITRAPSTLPAAAPPALPTTTSFTTTSTTSSTTTSTTSSTTTSTPSTTSSTTTTSRSTTHRQSTLSGIKPFSSIGVNLVVPNPISIINALSNTVKLKTGMFLDTVNYVLRG